MHIAKTERTELIIKALNAVGLSQKILSLKPTDLSAGQCQKVMIARAIVNSPQVVVADNPTSLMDADSEEMILNLLIKVIMTLSLSLLVIHYLTSEQNSQKQ